MPYTFVLFESRADVQEYCAWREAHPDWFILHIRKSADDYLIHQANCFRLDPQKGADDTLSVWVSNDGTVGAVSQAALRVWLAMCRPHVSVSSCHWCL